MPGLENVFDIPDKIIEFSQKCGSNIGQKNKQSWKLKFKKLNKFLTDEKSSKNQGFASQKWRIFPVLLMYYKVVILAVKMFWLVKIGA